MNSETIKLDTKAHAMYHSLRNEVPSVNRPIATNSISRCPVQGVTANSYRISFWGNENVLNWVVQKAEKLCKYPESHGIMCSKWVNHMACELSLNKAVFKK